MGVLTSKSSLRAKIHNGKCKLPESSLGAAEGEVARQDSKKAAKKQKAKAIKEVKRQCKISKKCSHESALTAELIKGNHSDFKHWTCGETACRQGGWNTERTWNTSKMFTRPVEYGACCEQTPMLNEAGSTQAFSTLVLKSRPHVTRHYVACEACTINIPVQLASMEQSAGPLLLLTRKQSGPRQGARSTSKGSGSAPQAVTAFRVSTPSFKLKG